MRASDAVARALRDFTRRLSSVAVVAWRKPIRGTRRQDWIVDSFQFSEGRLVWRIGLLEQTGIKLSFPKDKEVYSVTAMVITMRHTEHAEVQEVRIGEFCQLPKRREKKFASLNQRQLNRVMGDFEERCRRMLTGYL
jgi:hypothetical protein